MNGSSDGLDDALALANGSPTARPAGGAGGACADCPARGSAEPDGPVADRRPSPSAAPSEAPPDDDLAGPWLSAASTTTDGLRSSTPPSTSSDEDLAPDWLLAAGEPETSSGGGVLPGVMRALRRPAESEKGEGGAGAAGDGLLPEWLTRAARWSGAERTPDRPAPDPGPGADAGHGPASGEDADPDDALAAPWVPRERRRAPARPPEDDPPKTDAPAAGPAASGEGTPGRRDRCRAGDEGGVPRRRAAADAGPDVPTGVRGHRAAAHSPALAHATWDGAQRIAARAAAPGAPVTVPLDRAARQVLAAPVEALADLPSFDTSAMDGWAVAGPGPWVLAGPADGPGVLAGRAAPEPLADGCAVRIATGARVPEGATAVLRSERAEVRDGRLRPAADAPPHCAEHGTDIRPRGQECRAGDRLLPAGTPVTPPVLGLAAAAGYDRLTVTPRPRAEVLVLGDELLHTGLPHDGRIRDALGPMVGPWLTALGAEVLVTRRLGDDAEALHEAVTTTTADLVVTTGGTAHGPADHLRPTLRRIGARLLVDGVEVRPGHPMLLAALEGGGNGPGLGDGHGAGYGAGQEGRHLVGLPGNPLAAVSGLLTLAAPLLRARAGLPEPEPVRATLTAEVTGHPRDTRLVPVTRSADGSGATPLRWTGPAMLRGIAAASALAVVPPGGAAAGTSVRLLEMPW